MKNICLPTGRYISLHQITNMETKERIIQVADTLIRDLGYNAFSFHDISNSVGIRKASIHYHFPSKADLGAAVIDFHIDSLQQIKADYKDKSPIEKLDKFLSIYKKIKQDDKICLVGMLSTDFHTLDEKVTERLTAFSDDMLNWVTTFLKDGRTQGLFAFSETPRTKAILTISNMIALLQLTRLTNDQDFDIATKSIKKELIKTDKK